MKFLALLIILAGFGLVGSAFFGVYTAPGLEALPTVESLGLKEREEEKDAEGEAAKKPSGIFPINEHGKISERNNYLNKQKGNVAPGS